MRICKIYDGDYPWDIRVEKILTTLAECGHEIHLVCRNLAKRPLTESTNNITIHRLPAIRGDRVNGLSSFPAFFNPRWLKRVFNVIREHQTDLIMVRDLPLALTAILAARRHAIPVILDMAENYPAMLSYIWRYGKVKPANLLVRNPWGAKIVERIALKRCDHILVVIEESRNRLLALGVDPQRVSVLMNTPRLRAVSAISGSAWDWAPRPNPSDFIAVYVGGIDPGRGLDQMLTAIPSILERVQGFRFLLIGSQGGDLNPLKDLARRLGVEDHVIFKGWVEPHEVGNYIFASDVGVIPHRICAHTSTTVPNKLFDYMAYAKPVISSNLSPVRRIVQAEDCGIVYESQEELVEATAALSRNAQERQRMGANGRHAVLRTYNWEHNADVLLHVIANQTRSMRLNSGGHAPAPRTSMIGPR